MAITVRQAQPDDLEPLVALDFRNFGVTPQAGDIEAAGRTIDLNRFVVAAEGSRLVGVAGSHRFDLTLPGGGNLPMSGGAWVSVAASHRRRGLLRAMMSELDQMAAQRGEPLLGLRASEAAIYERFGFGAATRTRPIGLDRRHARIDPQWTKRPPDPIDLVVAQDHLDDLVTRWDRYRQTRPGELSRTESQLANFTLERETPVYAGLHPDGYVTS